MKKYILILLLFINTYASNISIIVNKDTDISNISKKDIKELFLLNKQFIGSIKIIPLNILGNNEIRVIFEKNIIKMNKDQLNEYWTKKHFQGITPPLTQQTFEAITMFVSNVPGAIAYIPSELVDQKVKVIYEF